jgi:Uma2 family endonuclease
MQPEKFYTAADFQAITRLPENLDRVYELNNGKVKEMNPRTPLNARVGLKVARYMDEYAEEQDLGIVFGVCNNYQLDDKNIRMLDAAFIKRDRLPQELPEVLQIAPDLAVSVVGQDEAMRTILDRMEFFFNAGTQLFWVLYPEDWLIEIWKSEAHAGMRVQKLGMDKTLSGDDVLPGFFLPISKLFPPRPEIPD